MNAITNSSVVCSSQHTLGQLQQSGTRMMTTHTASIHVCYTALLLAAIFARHLAMVMYTPTADRTKLSPAMVVSRTAVIPGALANAVCGAQAAAIELLFASEAGTEEQGCRGAGCADTDVLDMATSLEFSWLAQAGNGRSDCADCQHGDVPTYQLVLTLLQSSADVCRMPSVHAAVSLKDTNIANEHGFSN